MERPKASLDPHNYDDSHDLREEKPKGQISELYRGVVRDAIEDGRVDGDEKIKITDESIKKEAKVSMRERGEYLEKYNPGAFNKVLELRGWAKMVKDLMDQAEKTDDPIIRLKFRTKAKEIGDYNQLIREAVELFNTSYAEIEDKVKEEKAEKARRKEEDAKKIEEARVKIAWLHSPKNPDNFFKKKRLDDIEKVRAEKQKKEADTLREYTRSPNMGRGNMKDSDKPLRPIPGEPMKGLEWADPKKHVNQGSEKYAYKPRGVKQFLKRFFGGWKL